MDTSQVITIILAVLGSGAAVAVVNNWFARNKTASSVRVDDAQAIGNLVSTIDKYNALINEYLVKEIDRAKGDALRQKELDDLKRADNLKAQEIMNLHDRMDKMGELIEEWENKFTEKQNELMEWIDRAKLYEATLVLHNIPVPTFKRTSDYFKSHEI